jgi:hypothetical protein
MTGNIIGEPFEKYVKDQITLRQEVYGSGFDATRTPEQINYLNTRTAWIKMASSVSVDSRKRLTDLNLNADVYSGQQLAKKAILFRTISELNSEGNYTFGSGINKSTNNIWNTQSAYGLGGNDFGIQPPPGIVNFTATHLNRGSIRKGTVTLKAYNKVQFEIIELLYLRLGYTMLLEWGNNSYFENTSKSKLPITNSLIEKFWFQNSGTSHRNILRRIDQQRKEYDGNYDGFFGKVSNFNWSFNPDGSYNITIDLVSLGDIIESLNINIVDTNNKTTPSSDSNDNGDIISNFLSDLRRSLKRKELIEKLFRKTQTINEINNIKNNTSGEITTSDIIYENEVVDITQIPGAELGGIVNEAEESLQNLTSLLSGARTQSDYSYYIRFGAFIHFLNKYIFPRVNNSSNRFPIIAIKDRTDVNIMNAVENQFSFDPKVCFVRNDNLSNIQLTKKNENDIVNFQNGRDFLTRINSQFKKWLNTEIIDNKDNGQGKESKINYGYIMNIYLNFAFIEDTLTNNLDDKGNLSIYNFLKTICNRLNRSLGGINNLEPIIDEEKNLITLIDSSTEFSPILKTFSSNVPFNLFGYNNGNSNFVKKFDFQTQITPDLANLITIGATAQGEVVGEDATAFSSWNKGLRDRFKQKISNADSYQIKNQNQKQSDNSNTFRSTAKVLSSFLSRMAYRIIPDEFRVSEVTPEFVRTAEENFYINNSFDLYLIDAFGGITQSGRNGNIRRNIEIGNGRYFRFDDKFTNRGIKIYNNLVKSNNKKENNTKNNTLGFIPVRLSLTLDGISGIKIYQKLLVNQEYLPRNYPTALEFIVIKVSHSLSNNNWETTLETISLPKNKN